MLTRSNGSTNLHGFVRRAPVPRAEELANSRDPSREHLRQAISTLQTEKESLGRLDRAREKAREDSWAIAARLTEAKDQLQKAREQEPARLARAAARGEDTSRPSPVVRAQTSLTEIQTEYQHNQELADALDGEITKASNTVQQAQHSVHAALSEVVCSSPELQDLFAELELSWGRLRGIRKAFAHIQRELHGQMPQSMADRWFASISLNHEAQYDANGPIPTDDGPVTAWSEALVHLLEDPNSELPTNV